MSSTNRRAREAVPGKDSRYEGKPMKFLCKRFLLSALGAFVLTFTAQAQEPVKEPIKTMPKGEGTTTAPTILRYEHNGSYQPSCQVIRDNCAPVSYCDNGCGRGGLVGGASLLYLRPHFTSNPSLSLSTSNSTTIVDVGTGATNSTTSINSGTPDFSHDFSFSPRLWIGFQGECLGARARWFHF